MNENYIVKYPTHLPVTVGSLWDYNQALCNSPRTKRLKVKRIYTNGAGELVEFEQRMAFTGYGIDCFDGRVFKPSKP